MMYERFKSLCEKKGVTISAALKDLGIAKGMAANWRTRNSLPSGQNAIKIAEYFGITTDEVLGHELPVDYEVQIAPNEKILIETYRNMDEATKVHLANYIKLLESEQHKTAPGISGSGVDE